MTKSKTDGPRPNPEVPERAKRRRFSADYKLRILQEADRCKTGELLPQGQVFEDESTFASEE